jgi:hypothetical protein
MPEVDPSEMPWSGERLDGLADALAMAVQLQTADFDNPDVLRIAHGIARWTWVRASKLKPIDIVDAIGNTFGRPDLPPYDSALGQGPPT